MKLGNREFGLIKTISDKRHYISLFNAFRLARRPLDFFGRYFLAKGVYPCPIGIKTPIGTIEPVVYSYYDSLTINEIFFRQDYRAGADLEVAVDIGANIGISALYFLTRNNKSKVYLYEPVPENLSKLKDNLNSFKDRIVVNPSAVYTEGGVKDFGTEEFGRCGGLNRPSEKRIKVDCLSINDVLASVLAKEDRIDILKIDIEGDEVAVVKAIDSRFFGKIGVIYFEIDHSVSLPADFKIFPEYFQESRYGNTYIMKAL